MTGFADIYRRHHDLYGGHAYHPVEIEVVQNRKLFTLGIDQELSEEQKVKGVRNAIVKATFSLKEAMQYFFLINEKLDRQTSFLLRTECPQVCEALRKIHAGHIRRGRNDYKIEIKRLKDLVDREGRMPEDAGRVQALAAFDGHKNMRYDKPSLVVEQLEKPQRRREPYLLCTSLSAEGTRGIERKLMSFDDALHT
ncbi:Uncharacterised protein [uncultured archaeon]|nr:Uncharacterised protein [uncultured archaeon]